MSFLCLCIARIAFKMLCSKLLAWHSVRATYLICVDQKTLICSLSAPHTRRALNDALAGSSQLLHCGRGDALSITMLDQEGNVAAEFPPLKTGEKQDSSSQWQSSVSAARRIYVAVSSSDS